MIRLLVNIFRRQFRTWDRPSQLGFILGLILVVVMLLLAFTLPPEDRASALAAAGGVWFVTQLVILWANRGMVTPYTRAQRLYLRADFAGAAATLEQTLNSSTADAKTLTLLGNTYRQLGRLDESEETLTKALVLSPNHHFPLYGFGRTLLVKGAYPRAIEAIQAALEAGAPPAIQADLGEALLYAGREMEALQVLESALPAVSDDAGRRLRVAHLLHTLNPAAYPAPTRDIVDAGLAYWRATAERFSSTPYGQRLMHDVKAVEQPDF
jgi:tetratricopeptide (TPR) repeat protein